MKAFLRRLISLAPKRRKVAALMESVARPSVSLCASKKAVRSYLGGTPTVPLIGGIPVHAAKPLPLSAQIDLEELQLIQPTSWLPKTGTLLFFYDHFTQSSWGFDPNDKGSFLVIYSENKGEPVERLKSKSIEECLNRVPVKLNAASSFPSWERDAYKQLALSEEDEKIWDELAQSKSPRHQMLGFPNNIQGDHMELECQLVSNGINCGGPEGYNNPSAKQLSEGQKDWRLLLQIDSDEEDLGVMWGDVGRIYFWIREQDAVARKFENAWMIFQCY